MPESTSQIGIRLPTKDVVLVRKICESRGEDVSDFVRRAIRKELASLDFLKPSDMQALGLKRTTDTLDQRNRGEDAGERDS